VCVCVCVLIRLPQNMTVTRWVLSSCDGHPDIPDVSTSRAIRPGHVVGVHSPSHFASRPAGFFPGMGKLGVWGRKSPNGVQGWSLGVGVGRNPQKPTKSAISLQWGPVDPKFQVEGVAPTNHSSSHKTRLNDLRGVNIWTDLSFVLSQFTRLTDRRTDGQLFHRYIMQRGNKTEDGE